MATDKTSRRAGLRAGAREHSAPTEAMAAHVEWRWRSRFVLFGALAALLVVAIGSFRIQTFGHDKYTARGEGQYVHNQEYRLPRRKIVDRNGAPLAVSAPRPTVIVDPFIIQHEGYELADVARVLAQILKIDGEELQSRVARYQKKRYMIVKRQALPSEVARIKKLGVPGIRIERTYRRYYPTGEVAAALLGFTNVDEKGQEGLERSFNKALEPQDVSQTVRRSRRGQILEVVDGGMGAERDPLSLTIDRGIQYVAYRELKKAVEQHQATGGAVVVLDVETSDVVAMVSYPSFNPHVRDSLNWNGVRNRGVGFTFEPASTMKPLIVAAGLQQGSIHSDSLINTSPGRLQVDSLTVRDSRNRGKMNLSDLLRYSSNVGSAKIALEQDREGLWLLLSKIGFGMTTSSGLPNEANGSLHHYSNWQPVDVATLSYGYGLSVTPLQLASAYATLGSGGVRRIPSIIRYQAEIIEDRVFDKEIASNVIRMMEAVVTKGGTAPLAAIDGYRVAGKTGTARKVSTKGGYTQDSYRAVFAGVVPATKPRFAAVVVIDDPRGEDYYGGLVAAPVFSKVLGDALRIWSVEEDANTPWPAAGEDKLLAQSAVERR
jgi:cell division protein FtsI (penicillin-binding protein 3)